MSIINAASPGISGGPLRAVVLAVSKSMVAG